jgi:hypothetical protein
MQAFFVSVIAGCLFPLLPIGAEFGLKSEVEPATLAVTGVVYAAAVGMGSRSQFIAFSGFFWATICAIIYGAETYGRDSHPAMPFVLYGPALCGWVLAIFATAYAIERFGRHWADSEPFLEF